MRARRINAHDQLVKASSNTPSLKRGASGAGVAELQRILRDFDFQLPISFSSGQADGVFGAETEAVVREFQRLTKLMADGIVGAKTMQRIDEVIARRPYLDSVDPVAYRGDIASDFCKPLHQRRNYYT
jgi:peptidoglycan hydrolase-like protein with peptidoglycan-binding domain